jgi:microcystin-dependent protein
MSSPFVAEIRILPYSFAPAGWASCDGQLLPLSQNTALFSLLGTYYGGDGKSNFALPNFQDSVPIHQGQGPGPSVYELGETGGSPTVTLTDAEMASHNHAFNVSTSDSVAPQPGGNLFAVGVGIDFYDDNTKPTTNMAAQMIQQQGGGGPHNNLMAFLGLQFCIALQGVFPPRG